MINDHVVGTLRTRWKRNAAMAMIKTPKSISQSLSRRPKSPFLQVQGKDVLSPAASRECFY